MFYNTLHKPGLRLLSAVFGMLIAALGLNLFIVPQNFYSGGLFGLCQLVRTGLASALKTDFSGVEIAGILYFFANIPILIYAHKTLGRAFVIRTVICTVAYSAFCSLVPVPKTPFIGDPLTSCLIGGILTGVGMGIGLTAGSCSGGLDVVGLCLAKKGSNVTVGKFSLGFNAVLYAFCLIFFAPEIAIYSIIYNFFTSLVLDRVHQQNVANEALIFTRRQDDALEQAIMNRLGRGVTRWDGVGAYTKQDLRVLCVCLSKYENEELMRTVHALDPQAFVTVHERIRIIGNFSRKVGQ